jgi:imidazolonepropionase-like amidohydrolase
MPPPMDRAIPHTRRRALARWGRRAAPFLAVVAATFAVAAIVPAVLYVAQQAEESPAAAAGSDGMAPPDAPPDTPTVLVRGARIVDVEAGIVGGPSDILVRDGRIAAVAATLASPRPAVVVDASGAYAMPGLVDTHVHLSRDHEPLLFLAAGVTTVQSLGGPLERNLATRDRIARGEIPGPRVVACDYVVRGGATAADAERLVDDAARRGVECIKVYSPPDWTSEAHAALVDAARRRGLRIGGHLPRNLPLADGLGHGQQFVAHAEEFLYAHFQKFPEGAIDDQIPAAVALTRRSGAIVAPTLVAYKSIVEEVGPAIVRLLARPELRDIPHDVVAQWSPEVNRYRQRFTEHDGVRLGRAFTLQQRLVRAWADAGVPLALGTDSSVQMPFVLPGYAALEELQELREAGVASAAALRAATTTGARLLGRDDRIGRIEAGYEADLILVNGNPLDDVAAVGRRRGVMARGRWMPEEWLQQQVRQRRR